MRLFVAFDVPDRQKDSVEKAVAGLRRALGAARWTPRESWHVTLKFLGEVAEDRLGEVVDIVAGCLAGQTPVATSLSGIGAFPDTRRPRVLWAGLSDEKRELQHLAARLEKKFGKAGFRQEARKLHPHLTLARFGSPPAAPGVIEQHAPYALDPSAFMVGEVILFRSRLGPGGARYEAIRKFPAGRPGAPGAPQ